jgi:hypothetical protein
MKILLMIFALAFIGCATVVPYDREFLADPMMNSSAGAKLSLEEKFFSTQEGSAGGSDGVAGGCGCAK